MFRRMTEQERIIISLKGSFMDDVLCAAKIINIKHQEEYWYVVTLNDRWLSFDPETNCDGIAKHILAYASKCAFMSLWPDDGYTRCEWFVYVGDLCEDLKIVTQELKDVCSSA